MRGKYIQSTITKGRLTLPVAIFIAITCGVVVYFLVPDAPREEVTSFLWKSLEIHLIPLWANKLACLFIYLGIGYLLIQINNSFGLVRIRASIQTSLYMLLIVACPALHELCPGGVATLLFVVAIYLLFSTYQRMRSSGYLFHAFFFVGLSSLLFPQITLLTPVLLVGAFNFQSLSMRSLFASIMGWSVPYWFLFGHASFYGNMELFYQPFVELGTFYPIDYTMLKNWEIAMLGYSFILFLVSSIHCFVQSYKDKIRTRVHLRFFILLNVCIYILIALQPVHCMNLLPLLLIGISILTSHMFVLTNNRASNLFFVGTIIGLILLFSYNLWTLL